MKQKFLYESKMNLFKLGKGKIGVIAKALIFEEFRRK